MNRLTLGQLARKAGLARSSLLHYEALGLLKPAGRSPAGYRLYGEEEVERLRTIRSYREGGLTLAAIGDILADSAGAPAHILEQRLLDLNGEILRLREQQKLLARLLAQPGCRDGSRLRGKEEWVAMLRQSGFGEEDMRQWHGTFEADAPDSHAAFLRSLGLSPKEVEDIRRMARSAIRSGPER